MHGRVRPAVSYRLVLQGFANQFFASVRMRAQAASSRLARATNREKLLLGGLVLGALSYGPIAALDYRTTQEDAYVDAVTERAAAQLESRAARRISSAAANVDAIRDMRGWGFQATNTAVAQVLIERRLLQAATDAGLARLKMTVDPDIETHGPTHWMSAQVEADLVWRGVFAFMVKLSAWPEGFQVISFGYEVRAVPPGMQGSGLMSPGTVRIGLAFPVEVEEDVAPAGATGRSQTQSVRAPVRDGMFDTVPAR